MALLNNHHNNFQPLFSLLTSPGGVTPEYSFGGLRTLHPSSRPGLISFKLIET